LIDLAIFFIILAFIAYILGARGVQVSLWKLQNG
jgi:hypothetical protein